MNVIRRKLTAALAAAAAAGAALSIVMLVLAFETNQAARIVVGHDFFNQQTANDGNPGPNTMNNPTGVYCDGTRLYVADYSNHRVMIFNTPPTTSFASASVFVGQPDGASVSANQGIGVKGNTLNLPHGVFATGTKLFVADMGNNRVLIYDPIPTSNNEFADVVLGQTAMTTGTANQGGLGANTLSFPRSVWVSNDGKMFIADASNKRVLVFNSVPTTNKASADAALGQTALNTNAGDNGSESGRTMDIPYSVSHDGTRLFVADNANNRILVFATTTFVTNATATFVIGQTDFSGSAGACNATSLWGPRGVYSNGTRLYITDYTNNRVLIWDSVPTNQAEVSNGPNVVVGQTGFSPCNPGTSQLTLNAPSGVHEKDSVLYITEYGNRRVVIYNPQPADQTDADLGHDLVEGQPGFDTSSSTPTQTNGDTLNLPKYAYSDGTKLYIADSTNNRVLIFNSIPAGSGAMADVVVGQSSLTNTGANQGGLVGANTLSNPLCAYATGTPANLYVADAGNHRVLIYNPVPVANNTSATYVVGQPPGWTTNGSNQDGFDAGSLSGPATVFVENNGAGKMYIADSGNHRVLVFNSVPGADNVSADYELGQVDLTTNGGINRGAGVGNAAANTLYNPTGVYSDGTDLFIADQSNHRVLIYNGYPSAPSNGPGANWVIGQADMTSENYNQCTCLTVSANTLYAPYRVEKGGSALYIADYNNSRVLIWNTVPASDNADADKVIGQPGFTTRTEAAAGGISARSLDLPTSASVAFNPLISDYQLFIADNNNSRVLIYYPYQESGQVIYIK